MKRFKFIFTISLFFNFLYAQSIESICDPWGCDHDLTYIRREKKRENLLWKQHYLGKDNSYELCDVQKSKINRLGVGRNVCKKMICFFQKYISPIDGPRSSFVPSSSQYTLEAIEQYGVVFGIMLGCDRLMRENKEIWIYETTDRNGITLKENPVPQHSHNK